MLARASKWANLPKRVAQADYYLQTTYSADFGSKKASQR